jgi:hypothetical protein
MWARMKLLAVPPSTSEPSARGVTAPRWRRYVRPQDLVWLLFFSALAIFGPERHPLVLGGLLALGVVQVLEPRLGAIASIVLELLLCFLIIGKGGGISSSYFVVLFLPVVSAGTNFGLLGPRLARWRLAPDIYRSGSCSIRTSTSRRNRFPKSCCGSCSSQWSGS